MKTTSKEWAQRLMDSGFKNTEWWMEPRAYGTYSDPIRTRDPGSDWLPAPTIGEIGEELSFGDLVDCFPREEKGGNISWNLFSSFLWDVMRSPDRMAEVWVWKMKGGR